MAPKKPTIASVQIHIPWWHKAALAMVALWCLVLTSWSFESSKALRVKAGTLGEDIRGIQRTLREQWDAIERLE